MVGRLKYQSKHRKSSESQPRRNPPHNKILNTNNYQISPMGSQELGDSVHATSATINCGLALVETSKKRVVELSVPSRGICMGAHRKGYLITELQFSWAHQCLSMGPIWLKFQSSEVKIRLWYPGPLDTVLNGGGYDTIAWLQKWTLLA